MDDSEDPTVYITQQYVEKALHNDFGPEAVLKSFQIKDFVKPGEGYIGKVTSAICYYRINENEYTVTYIAKLRTSFSMPGMQDYTKEICEKEAYFLTEVSPKLAVSLKEVGVSPLNVPTCVLNILDGMKSVLLMKDVREQNFMPHDSQTALDKPHVRVVMRELAKFHAAGYIKKLERPLLDTFPGLVEKWYAPGTPSREGSNVTFAETLKELIELLSEDERYASVVQYAKAIKMDLNQITEECLLDAPEKFETTCHGDLRDGNLMFRYSDNGAPEDVIFLDLQGARVASPGTDLNFFFFVSTDGDLRSKHFDPLLKEYYETLCAILYKASAEIPFTFQELKEEYKRLNKFGFAFGQFVLILFLKQYSEEPLDLSKMKDKVETEQDINERQKTVAQMKSHPMFKSRYLSMIKECMKSGVFDSLPKQQVV